MFVLWVASPHLKWATAVIIVIIVIIPDWLPGPACVWVAIEVHAGTNMGAGIFRTFWQKIKYWWSSITLQNSTVVPDWCEWAGLLIEHTEPRVYLLFIPDTGLWRGLICLISISGDRGERDSDGMWDLAVSQNNNMEMGGHRPETRAKWEWFVILDPDEEPCIHTLS